VYYLSWTVSLSWVDAMRDSLFINIDLGSTTNYNASFNIIPSNVSSRYLIELGQTRLAIKNLTKTGQTQIKVTLERPVQSGEQISLSILNLDDPFSNILFNNTYKTAVLVYNTYSSSLPAIPTKVLDSEPPLNNFINTVTSIFKISTASIAAVMFVSSSCSINLGGSFIKLFQIIEILGKLYFTPVDFSQLMDIFLNRIYSISDLFVTNPDLIIDKPANLPNAYHYKLTDLNQGDYLLRSQPIIILVFISLIILRKTIIILHSYVFKKKNKNLKIILRSISNFIEFIFEMSFIDFAFYSTYALMGSYSVDGLSNWKFVVNKLLAFSLLYYTVNEIVATIYFAIISRRGDNDHLSAGELKDSMRHSLEFQIDKDYFDNLWVRLVNAVFLLQMFLYQIIITTGQNFPAFCIATMFLLCFANFLYFGYVTVMLNPFKTFGDTIQRLSYEICLLTLVTSISLRKLGLYYTIIDILTIALAILCIILQILLSFKAFLTILLTFCLKKSSQLPVQSGDRVKKYDDRIGEANIGKGSFSAALAKIGRGRLSSSRLIKVGDIRTASGFSENGSSRKLLTGSQKAYFSPKNITAKINQPGLLRTLQG
jgi:hypothetical protein